MNIFHTYFLTYFLSIHFFLFLLFFCFWGQIDISVFSQQGCGIRKIIPGITGHKLSSQLILVKPRFFCIESIPFFIVILYNLLDFPKYQVTFNFEKENLIWNQFTSFHHFLGKPIHKTSPVLLFCIWLLQWARYKPLNIKRPFMWLSY